MFFKIKFHTPLNPSSKKRCREDRLVGATKLKSEGVMHEVGKESVPVIWNFLNRIVKLNSSETTQKDHFQQLLQRFSKDINEFSFKASVIVKKSDDFIYYILRISVPI